MVRALFVSKENSDCELDESHRINGKKRRKSRLSLSDRLVNEARKSGSEKVLEDKQIEKSEFDAEVGTSDGSFYGLPASVRKLFREERGITDVYEWQDQCLKCAAVRDGRNLILSLPTSGGKTLVAEILMLQQVLLKKLDALLILPFVSIVQEKIKSLIPMGLELGFLVEEYAASKGRVPPVKRRKKNTIYVATIEKAQSLTNSLTETNRIDSLGLVVVDELHMIGENGGRGAVLEQTLTKLLVASPMCQIVGMSATIGNVEELQQFLSAELFTCTFRPVLLKEYVKIGSVLYTLQPEQSSPENAIKFERTLDTSTMSSQDQDGLVGLVSEVVPKGSCLVFCSTKKNAENVAMLFARSLPKDFKQRLVPKKLELLRCLKEEGSGNLCPILERCIPYGVAYHHSGLTAEERKLIQDAYLEGVLCLLTCTSTLAAGVNLPAKRVVIRCPMVGRQALSRQQYKQMCGRAGRAGLDSEGESVVILQPNNQHQFLQQMCGRMERSQSRLLEEGSRGIHSLLLSTVALKENAKKWITVVCAGVALLLQLLAPHIVDSATGAADFLKRTLLSVQSAEHELDMQKVCETALADLKTEGLIAEKDGKLNATPLGTAAYKGPISVDIVQRVFEDLKRPLREGLVLATHLHLLFSVVPYDLQEDVQPNWELFYDEFCQLSAEEKRVLQLQGIEEAALIQRLTRVTSVSQKTDVGCLKRGYLSLLLLRLWRRERVWQVSERFGLPRGWVQALLQSSAAFASCLARFCEFLPELWPYQCLLPNFVRQLAHCVQMELIPLMEIQGVQQGRARQLFSAGYKSVGAVADADVETLLRHIEHLSRKQAKQIVNNAKMLRQEELSAHMDKIEELFASTTEEKDAGKLFETVMKSLS